MKKGFIFVGIGALVIIVLFSVSFSINSKVYEITNKVDNISSDNFTETQLQAEVDNARSLPSPMPAESQRESAVREELCTPTKTPAPKRTETIIENPFPDLKMFTRDSDYEEIPYIDDETFKFIIEAYKNDDAQNVFETGDESLYPLYKEKFRSLVNLEALVFIEEIEQSLYLNEFDAEELSSFLHFGSEMDAIEEYDPTQYWYYFFDFTGDGAPDLIMGEPRSTLIIQYDEENDRFFLWEYYSPSPAIYGTLRIFWLGMNAHSRNLYIKLYEAGKEDMYYFYYYGGYYLPDGGDGLLYMVSLPHYADISKNVPIPSEIRKQAVFFTEYIREPLFRLNEEQIKIFDEAALSHVTETSDENSYTYDELFGGMQATETSMSSPRPSLNNTAPTPVLSGYTVQRVNSSSLLNEDELPWVKDLSFNIVQVEGMEDEVLQEKINKTILECMTHWVEDFESFNPDTISLITSDIRNPTIYLQTDSYLSFNNRFDTPTSNNNWDSIHDVITIDMKTGERVMLDDLFRVDGSFATRVFTFAENLEYMVGYNYGSKTLLEKLQEASLNNMELDKKCSTRASAMLSRTSFHLEANKLIITFHYSGARDLEDFPNYVINLDNLEDFLLVEKW